MRYSLALFALCAFGQTDAIIKERRAVAGVVEATRPATLYGDAEAIYEIGSISKVFTATLLADMVNRGEVALAEPIAKFLPKTVKVPERNGKQITLQDLATHKSALPRLPTNLQPKDPTNPYADYTVDNLYAFLNSHTLTRDIGAQEEYSNLGVGLLGHVLALRAGKSYEALLTERVLAPLAMTSTVITLTPALRARLVPGHAASGAPAPNWDLPTLAGAGAIRSSVNDMLKFAAAACGIKQSPLAPAFALSQGPVRLAWQQSTRFPEHLLWHNGGTGGYTSMMACSPANKRAAVVLSNIAISVDDIGLHLADSRYPLNAPQREVSVDPSILSKYVGVYELAPGAKLSVTLAGKQLSTQLTGQPRIEIYPSSPTVFFLKVVPAELTFGADGKQVTLKQNGRETVARRIADTVPAPAPPPKEISLSAQALQGFVGRYQLAPNFILTITQEGARLSAQATGQPSVPIYPSGPKDFFYKVVDAQITFTADGLVLHQNGADLPAKRIKE